MRQAVPATRRSGILSLGTAPAPAFTLIELLVVIAAIAILADFFYWYNTLNSKPPVHPNSSSGAWGLGLAKDPEIRTGPGQQPFGAAVKESDVMAPGDMVAFVDTVTRTDVGFWGGSPHSGLEYFYPHQDGVGASFCDGHVSPSDGARETWIVALRCATNR